MMIRKEELKTIYQILKWVVNIITRSVVLKPE